MCNWRRAARLRRSSGGSTAHSINAKPIRRQGWNEMWRNNVVSVVLDADADAGADADADADSGLDNIWKTLKINAARIDNQLGILLDQFVVECSVACGQ